MQQHQHGLSALGDELGNPAWFWASVITVVAFVVLLCWAVAMSSDHLDELQDIEAARQEAIAADQVERRRIAAMQAMCGGENAVYAEVQGGGMTCTNKRGLVTRLATAGGRP